MKLSPLATDETEFAWCVLFRLRKDGKRGYLAAVIMLWWIFFCLPGFSLSALELDLRAKETLTPVELDIGDSVSFRLSNGESRHFQLSEASARVLFTNLPRLKKGKPGGGTLYEMTCTIVADGQPLTLRRYVCSQEAFYEPYVINGVRIWFDAVSDVESFLNLNHGRCKPNKRVRLALQDAKLRICPEELREWCPLATDYIDIARTQGGDDCWMGAFSGADAHAGLDINHPAGTINYAPLDFDDHYLFECLAKGNDNNRWRGVRRWANGDTWLLQTHHLMSLLVPEHEKLAAGTPFCITGGVKYGAHQHSHYVFKVLPAGASQEVDLDPWIIYWQIFEDNKARRKELQARMAPLRPAEAGEKVAFEAAGSSAGSAKGGLTFFWTFGDGGTALGEKVDHVFAAPGVYPVTLTVADGNRHASVTQHITVRGKACDSPILVLRADDETSFHIRPADAMDVYGHPPRAMPHSLDFVARAIRPQPKPRRIRLFNAGGETLAEGAVQVQYDGREGWLKVSFEGKGNDQAMTVVADSKGMPFGLYRALISVEAGNALNSPQYFWVSMLVPAHPAMPPVSRRVQVPKQKVVDDADPGFYATPWFWVGHRFHKEPNGYDGFCLFNGERPRSGEFARFTPDLEACRYEVSFAAETPFKEGSRFAVRIRHAEGEEIVWMEPAKSRTIGVFNFEDGTDGFVEILAEGSTGQVIADAVIFKRLEPVERKKAREADGSDF